MPADFQSLNFLPQSADLGGQRVVFVYVRCRWLGECDHLVRALPDTIVRLVNFIRGPDQFLNARIAHFSQDFPDTIWEEILPQV